jgi:formylglycine-generating enzyme required for sulfatase activity
MKLLSLIISFIFCWSALFCVGQGISKKYSLPGFVQLSDTIFISATEMDIREYGRFLAIWRNKSDDPDFIVKAMPSPNYLGWTYWSSFSNSVIVFSDLYEIIDKDQMTNSPRDTTISFTYSISNWPVVNVTKQQASLYCTFKTEDYQVFYNSQKKKQKEKYPANLIFRLPTTNEWIYAASSKLDTAKYKYGIIDRNQKYSTPVSAEAFAGDTTGQSHPFSVTSGQLNKLKLMNMCGNVAELVADSDYVYGGSFIEGPKNCTVTSRQKFTEPKNNIGFRIVAVIRNK